MIEYATQGTSISRPSTRDLTFSPSHSPWDRVRFAKRQHLDTSRRLLHTHSPQQSTKGSRSARYLGPSPKGYSFVKLLQLQPTASQFSPRNHKTPKNEDLSKGFDLFTQLCGQVKSEARLDDYSERKSERKVRKVQVTVTIPLGDSSGDGVVSGYSCKPSICEPLFTTPRKPRSNTPWRYYSSPRKPFSRVSDLR